MNAPLPTTSGSPRIIVADDHAWIRKILVKVIQEAVPAAEVIATENGLEALPAYEQGGANFLVTDHHMPEMDGAVLTRQVRSQAPDLPILMVSVQPEAKADAKEAGATWFLSKDQIMEHLPPLLLQHALIGQIPLEK